jgi:hypothetical protein
MKENNAQINEPIDINHAKKKKSKANKPINSVPNLSNKRQLNQRQLKAKVKLLNHLESIFSILFIVFYTSSVFMQFKVEKRFKTKHGIYRTFNFTDDTKNYTTNDSILNVQQALQDNSALFSGNKLNIVSKIRVTQRRTKLIDDPYPKSPLIIKNNFPFRQWKLTEGVNAFSEYDSDYEEANKVDKSKSFLEKGGIVSYEDIDTFKNINYNEWLNSNQYSNSELSSLTYDFVVVNYENGFVCSVIITNELNEIGINIQHIRVYILDRNYYEGGWAYFRIAMEIAFVVFFICDLIVVSMQKYYLTSLYTDKKPNNNNNKGTSIISIVFRILFGSFLSIAQLITYLCCLISICLWCAYIAYIKPKYSQIDAFLYNNVTPLSDATLQNQLITAGRLLIHYKSTVTVAFLFMFLHFVEIFARVVKSSRVFLQTLKYSFSDVVSFFIFFMCILLGFTLFTWVYYGRWFTSLDNRFNTLGDAFQQNFAFAMGIMNTNLFQLMFDKVNVMTVFYFLFLVVIIRFIVIKIILAILMHFFKIASDEYQQKKFSKIHKSGRVIKRKPFINMIYKYSEFVNFMCDLVCCRCAEKQPKIGDVNANGFLKWKINEVDCPERREEKKETPGNNDVNANKECSEEKVKVAVNSVIANVNDDKKDEYRVSDSDSKNEKFYDLGYEDDYEFSTRNAYFDSEIDGEKVKIFYEAKYRKSFIKTVEFLVFIIIFIIVFIFNVLSPWRKNMSQLIHTKLSTSEAYMNIHDLQTMFTFLSSLSSNFFNNSISTNTNTTFFESILIKDTLLFTLRDIQTNDDFKSINIPVRKDELFQIHDLTYENATVLQINDNLYIPWEQPHTYQQHGGYPFTVNTRHDELTSLYSKILQKETLSYIILEFFIHNPHYNICAYVKFEFKNDYAGYFSKDYQTYFMKLDTKQKPLDIVKYVFEALFIVVYIYMIIRFVLSIKENIAEYKKWYRDVIYYQNLKVKYNRNRIEPEFLRKFRSILSLSTCIEFIIILMTIGIIYTKAKLWYKENELYDVLVTPDTAKVFGDDYNGIYKLRDIVYSGVSAKNNFEIVGSIILFLACVKLISVISLGKFFSLIIRTFDNSKSHIISFIVILILIQLCFVFYAHLSFGDNSIMFYQVEQSIVNIIKVLFGYVDWVYLQKTNKAFGPIMYFIYLIVINLILLNLFVAIIYTSYIYIKKQIATRKETWSWKNVLCYCCRGNKSQQHNNELMIEAEFQYEKQLTSYESEMMLKKPSCELDDWIRNEMEQVLLLNNTLYGLTKKKRDVEMAYETSKLGKELLFEDNIYKNISVDKVRAFKMQYLANMSVINEQIEKDVIDIDLAIKRLEEHEAFMNYDKLLNEIGNKNQQMKNMIQDMDDNFVEIYNDLGRMYKHVVNKDDKENEHENENEKKNNDNNVGNSSSSNNNK